MIQIEHRTGAMDISDIELDGSLHSLRLGGPVATGMGPIGTGLALVENSGPGRLAKIHSHHQPQERIILKDAIDRTASTVSPRPT